MKFTKLIASILLSFVFLFLPNRSIFAQSGSAEYIIENFESKAVINQDTSVLITEKIDVNFFVQKHGIYRIIPMVYSSKGKTLNTRLSVVSVTDSAGKQYKYSTSSVSQSIQIKIGDPNTTLAGRQSYVIAYRITGFLLKYSDVPEFYWNVTGHEWDVPILKSSATVESPFAGIAKVVCYSGKYKSTETNCTSTFDDSTARFSTTKKIDPGSDFTIAVGLDPVNQLQFPGPVAQTTRKVADNWGYLAALVPVFIIFLVWLKTGRDEKFVGDNIYYKPENPKTEKTPFFLRKFLPTVYSPINGLTPAEVGTIVDEKVDTHDLIAEIIELGRLGIIKIERIKKKGIFEKDDYSFTRLTGTEEKEKNLKDFQKEILKELFRKASVLKTFGKIDKVYKNDSAQKKEIHDLIKQNRYVLLSALKLNFYEALEVIKDKLYKSLVKDQIFARNPEKFRNEVLTSYILLSGLYDFFVMTFYMGMTGNPGPLFLSFITIPLGIPFALNLPKRKAWGYSLYRQAEGLRHYIKVGKWRQEVAEREMFIEEMLPLAISLQVVGKLANDMEELGIEPPRYMGNFTVAGFCDVCFDCR